MQEKWVKFWKGVYVFAFGIRTFLIGNLIFDVWPPAIYQIASMHFGGENPRKTRAAFSLIYCYLCALVSIFEPFLMFYVSDRISILKEKNEMNELEEMVIENDGGEFTDYLKGIDEKKTTIKIPMSKTPAYNHGHDLPKSEDTQQGRYHLFNFLRFRKFSSREKNQK